MGLETATYITGLTPSWPPSSDFKSQGDDHIRLIKSVLQSTFPSASKALYFPKGETVAAGPMVLDTTDQNNVIMLDTTAGNINVTLPSGFAPADAGWSCEIAKSSADTNAAIVAAASGNILSQVGATATIRVGTFCVPARFVWTGAAWMCVKPGPMIGTTFNFDGTAVPYGCLVLDGSTFVAVSFAELNLALGTNVLRDKRGRTEAGVDSGGLRLTSGANGFGVAAVNGAVGGSESNTLDTTRMPAHNHGGTGSADRSLDHTHVYQAPAINSSTGGGAFPIVGSGAATNTGTSSIGSADHLHSIPSQGGGAAHNNTQPTIVTQKLIRAC